MTSVRGLPFPIAASYNEIYEWCELMFGPQVLNSNGKEWRIGLNMPDNRLSVYAYGFSDEVWEKYLTLYRLRWT